MRSIHLVRHARTGGNLASRAVGRGDDPIRPEWAPAVEATAAAISVGPVHRIVSSPVARALQTARPLAELTGLHPVLDERFSEIDVGPWLDLTEDEVALRWPEDWHRWRSEPHALVVEGRETLPDLYRRTAEGLAELVHDVADDEVVVVFTHDAVIRAAVSQVLGAGPESYRNVQVDNCSITTIAVDSGVMRLVRLNDRCHLAQLALDG